MPGQCSLKDASPQSSLWHPKTAEASRCWCLELSTSSTNRPWFQQQKWKELSTLQRQTWFAYMALDVKVGNSWKHNYSWSHSWLEIGVTEHWIVGGLVRLKTILSVKCVLYQHNRRDSQSWLLLIILLPLALCTENRWSYGQETSLRNWREP